MGRIAERSWLSPFLSLLDTAARRECVSAPPRPVLMQLPWQQRSLLTLVPLQELVIRHFWLFSPLFVIRVYFSLHHVWIISLIFQSY